MTRPTYGSLFSGVGGMDMGFDTHMDCVFQVEWDKHAQSILRRHWPDVAKWGDVQEVNGADLPPCDVLTFGSPCQDLSVAGKRAGLDGGRSSMFYEAIRIIKEMRDATSSRPTGPVPRIAVWENVPGALSSNKGADFQSVVDEMVDLGACLVEWAVLDAQHFGVPQRRRRVFLVAIFDPATANRCPDPLLPVSEGRRGDFAKGKKKGEELAGTIGGGSGSRGWSPDTDRMTFIPFVKARRAQNDTDDETWVEGEVTPTLNAFDNGGESRATVLMPIVDQVNLPLSELGPTLTTTYGSKNYSNHQEVMSGSVIPVSKPIPIQGTIIGRSDTAGPQGTGIGQPDGVMFTLDRVSMHGVAQPIIFENSFRDGIRINDGISHCLPAKMGTGGGNQPHVAQLIGFSHTQGLDPQASQTAWPTLRSEGGGHAVLTEYAVRRLTPLECERLMGWPDDHTRYTDTGKEQADSNRYKQCGNGVATPVARWIASHLKEIL
jgi:DNA (cytosine-5)-methyltransferase 1